MTDRAKYFPLATFSFVLLTTGVFLCALELVKIREQLEKFKNENIELKELIKKYEIRN